MAVERPDDFEPDTVPAVMPQSVRRANDTGYPTQALLDYEQALQAWMKNNVVDYNRRLTKVFDEIDGAYAAVTEETVARVTADEAFAGQFLTVEARLGDNEAKIQQETTARVTADQAIAQQIVTANARIGSAESQIQTEITARSTADSALAQQIVTANARIGDAEAAIQSETTARINQDSALAGQITNANVTIGNVNSALSNEISARINGDQAISQSVTNLSTTVNGNTASISTLSTSVNGLGVKYAVTGYVGGSSGGFVFTGVQRADGVGANYLLEINANVIINGTLLVNGTVVTEKAAPSAFTNGVGAESGGTSAGVGITVRDGAKVAVMASFNGASGAYFPLGTSPGQLIIYRDGAALKAVNGSYEGSGSGSSAGIALQSMAIIAHDTPGAGGHYYQVYTSNSPGLGGVSIIVIELAR